MPRAGAAGYREVPDFFIFVIVASRPGWARWRAAGREKVLHNGSGKT
jgi:hypothetical protein